MSDFFGALFARSRAWFEQAHRAGWLDDADCARLAAVEHGTPADLFVDQQSRPLVVAIFGGTGVGKSSLLNRLAGQLLARTGVERPTSREVTVYVHESVQLAELPPGLPLDAVRIKRHASVAQREVLWIDAPDIDSTEEANRRCALAWLPHVDLMCYVVSPERYRDDVGWRVLRARGQKHGWLFVLNRWDEGDPRQLEDFAGMLRSAGFTDPLLLPTCCVPGRALASPDQFERIQAALSELLAAHGVRELTRLGHRARLRELRTALQTAEQHLGSAEVWPQVQRASQEHWQAAMMTIRDGAEWSLRAAAGRFASDGGILGQAKPGLLALRKAVVSSAPTTPATREKPEYGSGPADGRQLDDLVAQIWDDWTQSKLDACLDALELAARRAVLAPAPLRQRIDGPGRAAAARVAQHLRDHVRAALARPGGVATRVLRRITGFLMAFLPLVALLWVAWAVLRGYYAAAGGQAPFLGSPFAIHSALLVLLAWAVPFTLDRLLRPSLERAVLNALRSGLQVGLEDVGRELETALAEAAAEASTQRSQVTELLREVTGWLVKPIDARAAAIGRVLAARDSERATTAAT